MSAGEDRLLGVRGVRKFKHLPDIRVRPTGEACEAPIAVGHVAWYWSGERAWRHGDLLELEGRRCFPGYCMLEEISSIGMLDVAISVNFDSETHKTALSVLEPDLAILFGCARKCSQAASAISNAVYTSGSTSSTVGTRSSLILKKSADSLMQS